MSATRCACPPDRHPGVEHADWYSRAVGDRFAGYPGRRLTGDDLVNARAVVSWALTDRVLAIAETGEGVWEDAAYLFGPMAAVAQRVSGPGLSMPAYPLGAEHVATLADLAITMAEACRDALADWHLYGEDDPGMRAYLGRFALALLVAFWCES